MFRDRPLTWLFIAATIAVDCAVLPSFERIHLGLVFGQLSAAAVWLIMSNTFKLAKAGSFLAIISLVIGKYAEPEIQYYEENKILTRLVAFTLSVVVVTLPVALFGNWAKGGFARKKSGGRWQFSLIEMFGWTIIVAYASFTVRFINFEKLCELQTFWWIIPTVLTSWVGAVMLEIAAEIESDKKSDFKVLVYFLATLVWFIGVEIFLREVYHDFEVGLYNLALACYLISWAFVRRLDEGNSKFRRQTR